MMKLFIVDDEPIMRDGLSECYDWAQHGIEVVGTADDGNTALEKIYKVKPDIVLTDVKMPKMSGIEMADRLLNDPQTNHIKIIFVSGHGDLEYLKSAISMAAVDYILKPVQFDELAEVLDKAVGMIKKEEQQKDFIYDMEIKLFKSMPLLKDKFFLSLLSEEESDIDSIKSKLDFMDIDLRIDGLYNVFVINIDDKEAVFENKKERDKQLTSFAILNITNELVTNYFSGCVIVKKFGEFVGIVDLQDETDEKKELFSEMLNKIKDNLKNILSISVTIGVGRTVNSLAAIACSYESAKEAAAQRFFYGTNKIIVQDKLEKSESNRFKFEPQKTEKLTLSLKVGDYDKVKEHLEQIFEDMSDAVSGAQEYYRNICLQLMIMTTWVILDLGYSPDELGTDDSRILQDILKAETVYEMKKLVMQQFEKACGFILEKSNRNMTKLIKEIKEIIHKRFGENLALSDIANEVFLTPTYICLIFKQETGETINEYLTKVRIEQAKKLIKDSKLKFYNICNEVGYSDPNYFSRIFKKYTGYSPSEYREKI